MSVIFKPIRGDSGRLNDQPIQDGVMWFAKDTGKLYIDTEEQRHPINPDMVLVDTTANWAAQSGLESEFGKIYVYTDYRKHEDEYGNVYDVPGFKIGDGKAYLIDLPFAESNDDVLMAHLGDKSIHITPGERSVWNNKVRVFVSAVDTENLVFTTDQYAPDWSGSGFSSLTVDELPAVGEKGVVYLVRHSHSDEMDSYDEYIWILDKYEKLGHTDVDLSDYMKEDSEISNSEIEEIIGN